jgi:hypothetical protein
VENTTIQALKIMEADFMDYVSNFFLPISFVAGSGVVEFLMKDYSRTDRKILPRLEWRLSRSFFWS